MKENKFFAIIGPSGCGKGSIIKELKNTYQDFFYPISYTSRPIRDNEKNGETYHFVSIEEFQNKIKNNEFLEYQLIHNQHYYGTDRRSIQTKLKESHIIREIDYQGFKDIAKVFPKQQLVSIFLTTETWEELKNRIQKRQAISEINLKEREKSYHIELEFAKQCNHIIFNKDQQLDKTVNEVKKIINTYL